MNAYEKMRDALMKAIGDCADCNKDCHDCLSPKATWMPEAKAVITTPRRNCDVGTADEQAQRYLELKKEYIERVTYCPAQGFSYFPESLWWAQMPYEEGGAK